MRLHCRVVGLDDGRSGYVLDDSSRLSLRLFVFDADASRRGASTVDRKLVAWVNRPSQDWVECWGGR